MKPAVRPAEPGHQEPASRPVTVEALHAALLASASATDALERLFGLKVRVEKLPDRVVCGPGGEALRRAGDPGRTLLHRRSLLLCGPCAVSDADLWFDPASLEAGMLRELTATRRPFGHVIRRLRPRRTVLSVRFPEPDERFALVHQALLTAPDGAAIAEVVEHYFRDALVSA